MTAKRTPHTLRSTVGSKTLGPAHPAAKGEVERSGKAEDETPPPSPPPMPQRMKDKLKPGGRKLDQPAVPGRARRARTNASERDETAPAAKKAS